MKKSRIIYSILAILFGVFLIIYGGYDDSPGGQLLGLVIAVIGISGMVKGGKKASE